MRNIIFILIPFFYLLIGCSSEEERIIMIHPNGEVALVEYYSFDDTIHPTRSLRYYANGEKQEEIYYNNIGEKDGLYTFWYQNGEKMFEGRYTNNKQNGTFTQWFDNGQVDYIGEYSQGRPTGTWKFYSREGTILSEQKME